ncbi:hypothetical protein BDV96DRAFT_602435 [Lophiotrema nucula]|uniref:DUF1772-domain-containing protein n=1 Tax=Lophiotrema nucula TaxID=690887 RepID=A0A6A5YXS5_9PLEO|nr:hypothetical protein BDV96DRAFT_602435 [Lophiotrema nucula]
MAAQSKIRTTTVSAQAVAVVTGSFLGGKQSSSHAEPANSNSLFQALCPTQLLRQWVRMYYYGHIGMPALCVATVGLYGHAALCDQRQRPKYSAAAATTLAMVPFTWVVMAPTNNILFGWETEATARIITSGVDLKAVQAIVVRWAWLHLARSVFPVVGVFLGFRAILQELGL